MQKVNPYAASKWSWRERQAVTTTGVTLAQMVGVVIHLYLKTEQLNDMFNLYFGYKAITYLMYNLVRLSCSGCIERKMCPLTRELTTVTDGDGKPNCFQLLLCARFRA